MLKHYSLENRPQDSRLKINEDDIVQTLDARMGMGGGNVPLLFSVEETDGGLSMETQNSIVRRLTPTECTLLQGFPKGWCDIGDWTDTKGKVHKDSDSAKYKALGNSIALPFWDWMAGRMVAQLKKDGVENPTMASLFDGISGFPLVYYKHGCTPVWSSEIEEYPIAVCKYHFGDDDNGIVGDVDKYVRPTT
jgi:DNA (cytosine-5)-methyltransferase 1